MNAKLSFRSNSTTVSNYLFKTYIPTLQKVDKIANICVAFLVYALNSHYSLTIFIRKELFFFVNLFHKGNECNVRFYTQTHL